MSCLHMDASLTQDPVSRKNLNTFLQFILKIQ